MPPAPSSDDLGVGPMIMSVTWSLAILSILAVAFRYHVRTKPPNKPASGDWIMLGALGTQVVAQSLLTIAFTHGMGRHDADLSYDPQLNSILKFSWLQVPFGTMTSILTRVSVTILLIKIFSRKLWLKVYLTAFTAVSSIMAMLVVVVLFAQVTPVGAIWHPMMPATRWNPDIQLYIAYVAQSLFTWSDITYPLFSIVVVWKLQMPFKKRLGLASILALSILTALASIMKNVTLQSPPNTTADIQYKSVQSHPWAFAEQYSCIILGSVPTFASHILDLRISTILSSGRGLLGNCVWSKKTSTDHIESEMFVSMYKQSPDSRESNAKRSSGSQSAVDEVSGPKSTVRTSEYTVGYTNKQAP